MRRRQRQRKSKTRRFSVHPIHRKRDTLDQFHHMFSQLLEDSDKLQQYDRMKHSSISELLEMCRTDLTKERSNFKQPISPPAERLTASKQCATCHLYSSCSDKPVYYRMKHSSISELLEMCRTDFKKERSNFKRPISPPAERLAASKQCATCCLYRSCSDKPVYDQSDEQHDRKDGHQDYRHDAILWERLCRAKR